VQAGANEVAIVSLDGEPKHLILPNTTRAFWKTITKVDVELLLRLKELEALEKLVEKVGRIDLHAGAGAGGFDALLQNLYSLREWADGAKPA
jgi:hypothetical protein